MGAGHVPVLPALRVSYEAVRSNEFGKLVTLDREGRSSAMSVLATSVLRSLRAIDDPGFEDEARKLLTFVDNRQDASLQAGHFNDFVQVAQLRGALSQALAAAPGGLTHDAVAQAVTAALKLDGPSVIEIPVQEYFPTAAKTPGGKGGH